MKANEWYLDIVEKKSGVRWRLVNGEWRSEDTGRAPEALSQEEFDRAVAFYRANEDFYRTTEEDLFSYRGNGPSPGVSRKTFNGRAAPDMGKAGRTALVRHNSSGKRPQSAETQGGRRPMNGKQPEDHDAHVRTRAMIERLRQLPKVELETSGKTRRRS